MDFSLDFVENAKENVKTTLDLFVKENPALFYADCRLESSLSRGAFAFNANAKAAEEDVQTTIGVRAFVKKSNIASMGFVGKAIGEKQLQNISSELKSILLLALKCAKINSEKKALLKKNHLLLGEKIGAAVFLQEQCHVDTVNYPFKKNPFDLSLEEIVGKTEKISQNVSKIPGIAANEIGLQVALEKKVFVNTSGSLIEQTWPSVECFAYVAAKGKVVETFYDWLGNFKGLEILDGENEFKKTFEEFCTYLAEGTVEVSNSPAMKTTSKEQTVITDPWFNALLSHEVMGHPSEADRALKKEAAWAGRAWWFNGVDDNLFESRVGSKNLTVFSDPAKSGYGRYKYDDEGTMAKKVFHIKDGVLKDFLNSVETSATLGKEPNGGMRAMSAANVPLIRMNNTAIAPGTWKKHEIFEETREGYYLVGQKTPSIGETRQNFKITCWKLYRIEKGEIKGLFRQGGITSDSRTFFNSIDAVANDFELFSLPNCGKGTPMQTMRVGNGGPHIRGKAIVSGAH